MIFEVHDLICGYDASNPVQRYLSFSLNDGEIVCVLGGNGCGKSTLFKTFVGLVKPLSGKMTVDKSDITRWSHKRLSSTIAYVPQSYQARFPYKVLEIVMLGNLSEKGWTKQPSSRDYYLAEEALSEMGIYHLRDSLYTDISGGELQLVMIARALMKEPRILILDEPTAALDYGNAVRVIKKIKELGEKGYAIMMTTHNPDHAFMCESNVLLLQKNGPMRFGKAQDIITEKNMQQALDVRVKIVEYVNENNRITRLCSPVF